MSVSIRFSNCSVIYIVLTCLIFFIISLGEYDNGVLPVHMPQGHSHPP
jgi:hypothetical protein